ncbi:hypothetical protein Bca101_059009 [Brassica carinata]
MRIRASLEKAEKVASEKTEDTCGRRQRSYARDGRGAGRRREKGSRLDGH